MHKIVLATGNQGKVRELSNMLAPLDIEIIPQTELGVESAAETGTTFVENAIIKARHAAKHTGLPAIADDSGLAVDYLKGAPGIYSSRYAGVDATDEQNVTKLLDDLKGSEENQRGAKFLCVLVYMRHAEDPTPIICQGIWPGHISHFIRGENGFGYDPIFWVSSHNLTAAQLAPAIKNGISHRGKALKQLMEKLDAEFA